MATKRITDLTSKTTVNPSDLFLLVDTSDTTMSTTGTDKTITFQNLTTAINLVNTTYVGTALSALTLVGSGTSFPVGTKIKYYIKPTGSLVLSMDSTITVPSDSSFTTKTLTAGKLYIVQVEFNGTSWMLETVIGGY